MRDNLLALAGGIVGGAIGFSLFYWLVTHYGLEGLVLPGGLLGIGAGISQNRSLFVPIACGISALALGIVAEWFVLPFVRDQSLGFFILHLLDLPFVKILLIALGGAIGFWSPFRRVIKSP